MDNLKLAQVSEASYVGVQPLKKLGFNRVVKFRSGRTGTKAYLAIDDMLREAVLVFRGTEANHDDILTDLNFLQDSYQNEKIHGGFLKAFKSVAGHINKELDKMPEEYCIYVTGHSLGGALACLYGVYGSTQADMVVTFGQPRVGNKRFAKKLAQLPYIRFVNNADIVPRVPKFGYQHAKHLLYIGNKGKIFEDPSKWTMFWDRISNFSGRFTDHQIANYVKALQ